MSSIPTEKIWIIHVRSFFEREEEDDLDKPASIFNVPKALQIIKPEAYTPQMIALGPYHHFREDLYAMERYKLIAAKRVQSLFKSDLKFQDLVDKLGEKELKIRASYHKYLTMDGETLAWMMAIDGLFLLQFLHIFVNKTQCFLANSARMSFLLDSKGKKLGYDSVLKDIMMLENQIPMHVMKNILKIQCSSKLELPDKMLPPMFLGVCEEISPLKFKENYTLIQVTKCAHLLDLLYQLIVPLCEESQDDSHMNKPHQGHSDGHCMSSCNHLHMDPRVFKELWDKVQSLGFVKKIKNGPLKLVDAFRPVIAGVTSHLGLSKKKTEENGGSSDGKDSVLQVEEIMIPSVTHLSNAGVEFCPSGGDISTIKFDIKTKKFYLPIVKLDVNSEVIMRNLVAYEASAISGSLVFARYTELMNGIVDTSEDVRILAEKKIIQSEFGYDEVAEIWNGMSKSIRLSRVGFMDEAITSVNAYFYSTKKVKFYRTMKAYVYGSWRMLVLLASLLVIFLMALQSFCTIYNCPRVFNLESSNLN